MDIKIGSDGGKSCQVTITGQLSTNLLKPEPVLFFKDLSWSTSSLRFDGAQYAIQEKMGFNLWWIMEASTKDTMVVKLIMPLESRGGYNFEKIQPIRSPEKAIGVALTSFKVTEKEMSFLIMLDFTR